MMRVCFVCLGNICRSPTAEAVFRKFAEDAGREGEFVIDSAGTAGYHAGEASDPRSRSAAKRRGYEMKHRARQFVRADFDAFDLVCAMDQDNLRDLRKLAPNDEAKRRVKLLRSYDPTAAEGAEVPDPYYGGEQGFDDVIDICERACRGLLEQVTRDSHPRNT